MEAKYWLYFTIVLGLLSLALGIYFLIKDLKKPKEHWKTSRFFLDISFFILFLLEMGCAVFLYVDFQNQIKFFIG